MRECFQRPEQRWVILSFADPCSASCLPWTSDKTNAKLPFKNINLLSPVPHVCTCVSGSPLPKWESATLSSQTHGGALNLEDFYTSSNGYGGLSILAFSTDSLECSDTYPNPSISLDSIPPSPKQQVINILQSTSQLHYFSWRVTHFEGKRKKKRYTVVSKLLRVKNIFIHVDSASIQSAAACELKSWGPHTFLLPEKLVSHLSYV